MTPDDVATFERCIAVGGVALFPADTVYGLATDPDSAEGVRRLYALKGRPPDRPAAVMFFRLELALAALPELPARARATALERLLPGRRDAAAAQPGAPLPARLRRYARGARPAGAGARRRARARSPPSSWPVLQSSANLIGRRPRRAASTSGRAVRAGVDLILDGGELPGTPSTVVDLTAYERDGSFEIVRDGAVRRGNAAGGDATVHPMSELSPDYFTKPVADVDPEIAEVLRERGRSPGDDARDDRLRELRPAGGPRRQGSVLTNKYAEGYPGKRYYGGCEFVDVAEQLAIDRAKELFGAEHVNVQPHSGAQANSAVYMALLEPGDRILGMKLDHGGHLTHGMKINFSGLYFDIVSYGVREEDSRLDMDELQQIAEDARPKLILAGWSAYSAPARLPALPRDRRLGRRAA